MTIYYPGKIESLIPAIDGMIPACRLQGEIDSVEKINEGFQKWRVKNNKGEILEFFLENPKKCPIGGLCGGGTTGKVFTKLPKNGEKIEGILYEEIGLTMFRENTDEEISGDLYNNLPDCQSAPLISWSSLKQTYVRSFHECETDGTLCGNFHIFSSLIVGMAIFVGMLIFVALISLVSSYFFKKSYSKKNAKSSK